MRGTVNIPRSWNCRTLCTVATLLMLLGLAVWAELPPQVYEDRKAAAPEEMVIRVISVELKKSETADYFLTAVTALVDVLEVKRSATDMPAGGAIWIGYSVRDYKQPRPGPSEPVVLQKGERYRAWLEGNDKGPTKTYAPAAGGKSFEAVK